MLWSVLLSVVVYFAACAAIGYWAFRRRKKLTHAGETRDYYIGNRSLGWVVLAFTILASAASAGTFIGDPGLAYENGYGSILSLDVGQIPLGFLVLGLLGKRFAILGRKLDLVTINDFFRHRYESASVVLFTTIATVVFLMAYMVAQFSGGARVIEAITGVPYPVLVIFFGAVVTLYTAFGGFLADTVSDTLQGVVMLVASVAIWTAVIVTSDGIEALNGKVFAAHPEMFTLPGASGYSLATIISFFFLTGPLLVVLPHLAVRGMAYKDSRAMHRAMYMAPIIMFVFTLGFVCMGPIARAYFPHLETPELAVPSMVLELLPGPVAGVILTAPLAAVMSTVDSMLLIVSAGLVRDLYANYVGRGVSERKLAKSGPVVSALLGVVITLLALNPPDYVGLLIVFAVGGLGASFFPPLFGGLYWKRGNSTGAVLAVVGGMSYYIVASKFFPPLALGMEPVVLSAAVSSLMYIGGSLLGRVPNRAVLVKFWGTQQEIDRLPEPERTP